MWRMQDKFEFTGLPGFSRRSGGMIGWAEQPAPKVHLRLNYQIHGGSGGSFWIARS